jgi:hypothetical protein
MKQTKKTEQNYIAPNCNVISIDMNALMAGSNGDWQVHDGEVPGQGSKQGGIWSDDKESDDEQNN